MIKQVFPVKSIKSEVNIPPSKSFSQRVIACCLLSNKKTIIENFGNSLDEQTSLEILKYTNKIVTTTNQSIIVNESKEITNILDQS